MVAFTWAAAGAAITMAGAEVVAIVTAGRMVVTAAGEARAELSVQSPQHLPGNQT
jgi:hypothetical protein